MKRIRKQKRPRLSVFVSNRHIWAQIIDDEKGVTLAAAGDRDFDGGKTVDVAAKVGELIAQRAKDKKIKEVFLDRGGYKYHGRIKSLAEAARAGGLKF